MITFIRETQKSFYICLYNKPRLFKLSKNNIIHKRILKYISIWGSIHEAYFIGKCFTKKTYRKYVLEFYFDCPLFVRCSLTDLPF